MFSGIFYLYDAMQIKTYFSRFGQQGVLQVTQADAHTISWR
jgi:hypothetical protein